MELVTMTRQSSNGFTSRLSSLFHSHVSQCQRLPRKPTIPNPRQTIVSTPPRRSSPSPQPDLDLQARAISTLKSLRSNSDASLASEYISSDVVIHGDDESITATREEFLSSWQDQMSRIPDDCEMQVVEAVVDEAQRKVWIRSEISGRRSGIRKQSVDMMSFDEEGLLIACAGSQCAIGKRERIVGE